MPNQELQNACITNTKIKPQRSVLDLSHETWKIASISTKENLNQKIMHVEKLLNKQSTSFYSTERFPCKIKDVKIIVGDYKHTYI